MNIKSSEKFLTILQLLIVVGVLSITPPQDNGGSVIGLSETLANTISYLILLVFIASYWKGFIYVATKTPVQMLLLILVLFSILWSEDIASSLTYTRGLIRIYLLAIYLAMRYSFKEQMGLLAWALGPAALMSLVTPYIFRGYGIHQGALFAGMWSGIYGQKNELGYMMAWSAAVFLHLGLSKPRFRWLTWTLFGISISLIVLSRSTTSLIIIFAMIGLLPLYRLAKRTNYKLQIITISFALMLLTSVSILLLSNAESLVGASGKDFTLSGRTDLWAAATVKILERPWEGYGFYGFWDSTAAANIRLTYDWASNAHNGFVELVLELGIIGLVIFAIGLFQFFGMAITRIVSMAKTPIDYFPMQMLIIIIIVNFSEARLLAPSWNWLVYLTVSLSLTLEQYRIRKMSYQQISSI